MPENPIQRLIVGLPVFLLAIVLHEVAQSDLTGAYIELGGIWGSIRPDSDNPDDRYRLYPVSGASHRWIQALGSESGAAEATVFTCFVTRRPRSSRTGQAGPK